MGQYDNFTNPMSGGDALAKLNGSMDSAIGHDHSTNPGNGNSAIPGSSIVGAVALATNATTAGSCTGNAATATLADAAKGDTRFVFSGCVGGDSDRIINSGDTLDISIQRVGNLSGLSLKVKRVRFNFFTLGSKLQVIGASSNWLSTGNWWGDETANTTIATGVSTSSVTIRFNNLSALPVIIKPTDSWWVELSIE
jgi:hypothetical protein